VTRIGKANFFFAPLRLGIFALNSFSQGKPEQSAMILEPKLLLKR
jgi:hypothetical protein